MIYDLCIIGGGPAGAAAGVYAARKKLKTVFITKDWLGQSNVSEKIENWIGNVAISGLELANSLEKHVKAYSKDTIDIKEGESCESITKKSSMNPPLKNEAPEAKNFVITTDKNSYQAKTILITSGSSRRKLDVPGADKYEHKGLTYCASCDGPMYSDQDVVVVGGGNAGFEGAAQLLAYCKSVTLLSRSEFRADPETIEKVLNNPKMKAVKYAVPKEIKGGQFVTSMIYTETKTNTNTEIPVTGIFSEIGSIPNTDFVKALVSMDKFNHIIVNPRNQRASIDGIWAAGDCTDGLYHQNNIAAGDAVKAIEDIYLFMHTK